MSAVQFPTYVEAFIQKITECFASAKCSVDLANENSEIFAREYVVNNPSLDSGTLSRLIVHRTARSMGEATPEYRARYISYPPPDFRFAFDDVVNRFVVCATVTTNQGQISIVSQCLIDENYAEILAAIMSVAAMNSIPSMVRWAYAPRSPEVSRSEWSDIDFEQLHYDFSHAGITTLYPRGVDVRGAGCTLSLTAVDNFPMWGGGLLGLLAVPRDQVELNGQPVALNDLNTCDFLLSDAPTFGAWCKDDDDYTFATFVPNFLKGIPQLADHLIGWASTRSFAVKSYGELMHLQKFDHRAFMSH